MSEPAPPPVARSALLGRALPGLRLRIGTLLALLLLLVGFVSIVWTPHAIEAVSLQSQLQDPSATHLLGTDPLGRDVLSLTMKGILTSIVVSAIALALGLFFGVPIGVAAAYWGGWADRVLMALSDFWTTVSAVAIAFLLTAIIGPGTLNAMLAIGLVNVAILARATRELLLPYRGRDHIAASRLAGLGGWELARLHVLPGLTPLLVAAALGQLGFGILAEAGLSYLGLAAQPPGTSLGLMLRDAQNYMALKPMLALAPGVALLLVAAAIQLVAMGLRERLGGDDAA